MLGFSGRLLPEDQQAHLRRVLEMTDLMRQLEQEFEQEGLQKGHEEVALRMLKEGLSEDLIQRTTGLHPEDLERLKRELH